MTVPVPPTRVRSMTGKVTTHGSARRPSQSRTALEQDHEPDAHASRDLVLLRLRHPYVRGAAEQNHHSDSRLPARLLHGRAGLADRVRGHPVPVRETTE